MEQVANTPITVQERKFSCTSPKEKYKLLTELSNQAKELIELQETESETVNQVLIEMYSTPEHKEFNTFMQWKKKGFKVIPGSKAFLIWSKPKANELKKKEGEDKKAEEEEGKKFFRLAYLFSNSQVQPIESK